MRGVPGVEFRRFGRLAFLLMWFITVYAAPIHAAPVFFEANGTGAGQNIPRNADGSIAAGFVPFENVPISGFFSITDQTAIDVDPNPLRSEFHWSFQNAEDLPALHDFRVMFGSIVSGDFTEQSDLALQAAQFEAEVIVQAGANGSATDEILIRYRGFHPERDDPPNDPYEIEFLFRPSFGTAPFVQEFPSSYVQVVALLRDAVNMQFAPRVTGGAEFVRFSGGFNQTLTLDFVINSIRSPTAEPLSQPFLISRAHDGGPANGDSTKVSMADDGLTLVFSSTATNLVEDDSNGTTRDIYLFDRPTGALTNLTDGANGDSTDPVLSKDGRWLAFVTSADNLATDVADTNGSIEDIVLMDIESRAMTLVTAGANAPSSLPSLDFTGLRMAFDTRATNLAANSSQPLGCSVTPAPGESRCVSNVMVYDRTSGIIILLTEGGETDSDRSQISPSGRNVAFISRFFYPGSIPGVVYTSVDTGEHFRTPLRLQNMSRPIVSGNVARLIAVSGERVFRGEIQRDLLIFNSLVPFFLDSEGFSFPFGTASTSPLFRVLGNNELPGTFADGGSRLLYTTSTLDRLVPDLNGSVRDIVSLDLRSLPNIRETRITSGGVGPSKGPATNFDGTLVAFESTATNFGATSNAGRSNIFLLSTTEEIGGPPVANAQQFSVQTGSSYIVSLTGSMPAAGQLEYEITSEPQQGTLQGVPPVLVYTPTAGFTGTDEFAFRISAGGLFSQSAVVAIDVTPAAPVDIPGFNLVAEQRGDSRVIDVTATFPPGAIWSQVREFEGVTTILRDGPPEIWTGSFTPDPDATEVTFRSRYWLPGVVNEVATFEVTVDLRSDTAPTEPPAATAIGGYGWVDTNEDGFRTADELGISDRDITLFRCAPPWGIAATATTAASTGRFDFPDVPLGEYQLGTEVPAAGFTTLGGDNSFFPNGFSSCFDFSGEPVTLGLGILDDGDVTAPDRVAGFAWIDDNGDGVRDADEPAESDREVTLFRCFAPYGQVGSAVTDGRGRFSVAGLEPGEYQLGTPIPQNGFAPLGGDNVVHPNGFANCVSAGDPPIGIGVL